MRVKVNIEKKDHYPWEALDTTSLMNPEELLTYHLYKLSIMRGNKKEEKNNRRLIAGYLQKISLKKEESSRCFQK